MVARRVVTSVIFCRTSHVLQVSSPDRPMVHACSAEDAKIIDDHTKLGQDRGTPPGTGKATKPAQFTDVKAAFERNYACLGIKCADVGGLWTGSEYYPDADPCVEASPPPPPSPPPSNCGGSCTISGVLKSCAHYGHLPCSVVNFLGCSECTKNGCCASDLSAAGDVACAEGTIWDDSANACVIACDAGRRKLADDEQLFRQPAPLNAVSYTHLTLPTILLV